MNQSGKLSETVEKEGEKNPKIKSLPQGEGEVSRMCDEAPPPLRDDIIVIVEQSNNKFLIELIEGLMEDDVSEEGGGAEIESHKSKRQLDDRILGKTTAIVYHH